MEDSKTAYSVPEDFNPHTSVDRVRALTDSIHHLVTEGEMTARPAPQVAYSNLVSLTEMLQAEVHELHAYLREIENSTTLDLPLTDEDFEALHVKHARKDEVKEEAALYLVRAS